jgi:hypothetical protein
VPPKGIFYSAVNKVALLCVDEKFACGGVHFWFIEAYYRISGLHFPESVTPVFDTGIHLELSLTGPQCQALG